MKKSVFLLLLLLSLLFPVCVRAESAIPAELPDLETEEIDRAAAGLSEYFRRGWR